MKCIRKIDLILVLSELRDNTVLSAREIGDLLDAFGDDWFIEGNRWVQTSENEAMAKLRKEHA